MEQYKINRINELSKKSKTVGLSEEEKSEQQILRKEYIKSFKNNLQSTLDNVVVMDNNGNKSPLKKKHSPN